MENGFPRFIEVRQNRSGSDRAFLLGTRVRVQDIVLLHERHGQTAEEIATRHYPHLTLAQVHAALAFYFEDRAAVWACIRADEADAELLREGGFRVAG